MRQQRQLCRVCHSFQAVRGSLSAISSVEIIVLTFLGPLAGKPQLCQSTVARIASLEPVTLGANHEVEVL
jgi:hypothetical protein